MNIDRKNIIQKYVSGTVQVQAKNAGRVGSSKTSNSKLRANLEDPSGGMRKRLRTAPAELPERARTIALQ